MNILLIIGSTRPVRVGPQLAHSIVELLAPQENLSITTVDLATVNLPFLDEPRIPALGDYTHEHTLAWSKQVTGSDAVIFLTPQYNGGYPASLKNAIDYLYVEWKDKPAAIISYGGSGGVQSFNQLHQILSRVAAKLTSSGINIKLSRDAYGSNGLLVEPAGILSQYDDELVQLITELRALSAGEAKGERVSNYLVEEVKQFAEKIKEALLSGQTQDLNKLCTHELDWQNLSLSEPVTESVHMLGSSAAIINFADATRSIVAAVVKAQYAWKIDSVFTVPSIEQLPEAATS